MFNETHACSLLFLLTLGIEINWMRRDGELGRVKQIEMINEPASFYFSCPAVFLYFKVRGSSEKAKYGLPNIIQDPRQ